MAISGKFYTLAGNVLSKKIKSDFSINFVGSVAQATSSMIDATRECQSRPGEVGPQMALRNAAENLVQVGG